MNERKRLYKLLDQNVGGWKCIRGVDIPASGGLNLTWKALSPNRGNVHNVDTAYDEASGSLGRVVLKIRARSKEEAALDAARPGQVLRREGDGRGRQGRVGPEVSEEEGPEFDRGPPGALCVVL